MDHTSWLGAYAGTYVSDELLGAAYRIALEKGTLVVRFRSIEPAPLKTMAPDQFTAGFFNLDFVRDKTKKISGYTLSRGRVAGIAFVKR